MRTFKVVVVGTSPYMQHRMNDLKLAEWEKARRPLIERDNLDTEIQKKALMVAYVNENGEYYIPSAHFEQAFIEAGKYVKGKVGGATKTMTNIVAAMFNIKETQIPFRKFDNVFEVSAVNRNVHARVMTYRPKWDEWGATFDLEVDDVENGPLTVPIITTIIREAGRYLGVGSYRPQHKGKFGKFVLDEFELISDVHSYQGAYFERMTLEQLAELPEVTPVDYPDEDEVIVEKKKR